MNINILNQNNMKKHVKQFLAFLQKETNLLIESSSNSRTEKFINQYGDPINVDTTIIDGKMALLIYSCGHKRCKNNRQFK